MAIQLMLKKSAGTDWPIFVRYSFNGLECRLSTKKKIDPKYWDGKKEQARSSFPGGNVALNRYLNKFKGDIERAVTDLENEGQEPAPDLVKEKFNIIRGGRPTLDATILTAWSRHITGRRKTKSPRTIQNETAAMESFAQYLYEEKKRNLSFSKLNKDIITGYDEDWLTKYTNNTKAKKMKIFKAFLRVIDHPVTKYISYKEEPGNKIFLTQSELSLFTNHDFTKNPKLDRVRDLFVLQCHTGLRVSDLKRLSKAHIHEDVIAIRAQKNKKPITMPVTPSIRKIFEKYNYELPAISDQRYNDYLKEVAQAVIPKSQIEITEYKGGVTVHKTVFKHEVLSSHCAVRTYITLKAQMGMPIKSIAQMTGKTVAVLLRNYIGEDEAAAFEDAKKYDFNPNLKINRKHA